MLFLGNKCFHTLQFDIETVDKRGISTTYIQGRQMQISKVSFSNEPGLEHLLLGASIIRCDVFRCYHMFKDDFRFKSIFKWKYSP